MLNIVWNEPSQEEIEEFMECASATGCSGELSSKGSSTFWTAKDKGHTCDGEKWSLNSLISSTSPNYNDLKDKRKGTYELSPGELEETHGIVNTEPENLKYTLTRALRKMNYGKLPRISSRTPKTTGPGPPPL